MSTPSYEKIASKTKNNSFSYQFIEKYLALMSTQQKQYSDLSYKTKGSEALIFSAKKDGIEEVALKVLECTDHTEVQIKAMKLEYDILNQLPPSGYFRTIKKQFFLTEEDKSVEKASYIQNSNTAKNLFFVQEMEMCNGNLSQVIQQEAQKGKDTLNESFKEMLAIQMLDAVNLLHQRQISHGKITTKNFLVSFKEGDLAILKLCNIQCISHGNLSKQAYQIPANQKLNNVSNLAQIRKDCMEKDLLQLGHVLLELDSSDQQSIFESSENELDQVKQTGMFKFSNQADERTMLQKIASTLLSKPGESSSNARAMLLLLLQKQSKTMKIPLFSIILKSQVNSLCLQIPFKRINLDYLMSQVIKQRQLENFSSWFDDNGQRKTLMTTDLLRSALEIMLKWEEFSGVFDILGVGVNSVVFGVENIQENRKSALRLSLCTNKADIIREIGIMRTCQSPYVVKFYKCKFFLDSKGNKFVVYELERCKYSLSHHLELQKIDGEYSQQEKDIWSVQILDSVRFLHENQILLGNIKLDSFLIAENALGQSVVKLWNFSHAAQIQQNFKQNLFFQIFEEESEELMDCVIKRHDRECPLYFAPERWKNPDLSTYFNDRFSVGLCIFFLGNYLVCSEEQLASKLISLPRESADVCLDINSQTSSITVVQQMTKQLLGVVPSLRPSLRKQQQTCSEFWKKNKGNNDEEDNVFQQPTWLTIDDCKVLDKINQTPKRFMSLYDITLNQFDEYFEGKDLKSILKLISNICNISRISFNLEEDYIGMFAAQSLLNPLFLFNNLSSFSLHLAINAISDLGSTLLLVPLTYIPNLSSLTLNLSNNSIGSMGAQYLLAPLANLYNLSSLSLNLEANRIRCEGAKSLLAPLGSLLNLSSLALNLDDNLIGEKGAKSLLEPLACHLNLSSLVLNLQFNLIGDIGTIDLLSPLSHLNNISRINLHLGSNSIGDIGAESLLQPLAHHLNLSSLTLNLNYNQIGDIGAKGLLEPLNPLLNLSHLNLNLDCNKIKDNGAQYLLVPLAHFSYLSRVEVNLVKNQIGEIGVKFMSSLLSQLLNLSSLVLNISDNQIKDLRGESLLVPLAGLINQQKTALTLLSNQSEEIEEISLITPVPHLPKIQRLSLLLGNLVGDIGAQTLLAPLVYLPNISSLYLDFTCSSIREIEAKVLLVPLVHLTNLTSLVLILDDNQIGDIGAQFLLISLDNLHNLSSMALLLTSNQIGEKGAKSLLAPLFHLSNLQRLTLNLDKNSIGDAGAKFLLSPLAHLFNLVELSLSLSQNQIGVSGAQSLFYPLSNILNLSNFSLDISRNKISDIGVQNLLSPLSNLLYISTLSLDFFQTEIGNIGASYIIHNISNMLSLKSLRLEIGKNFMSKKLKHLFKCYFKQLEVLEFEE